MAERINYLIEKDTRMVGDHLYRYWLALQEIGYNDMVVDVACGHGFGSIILAYKANHVIAIDKLETSEILLEVKHYKKENLNTAVFYNLEKESPVLVSFETIEHLENPQNLIKQFPKFKKVILSTPVIPTKHTNSAHLQDFTRDDVLSWFPADVWNVKWERLQNDIYIILCVEKRQ